jgi:thiol-disulfide isomerase/thioredoxin
MRRLGYVMALLVAALSVVAGCGGLGGQSARVAPPANPAVVTSTPAGGSVPQQLDFTATTVAGEGFSGATLFGKPAVLWFWAPWCPVCKREAPAVARAAHDNPGVRFVGVAGLDQAPAMRDFVKTYDIGFFPYIADIDGGVWQRFGVTQQPAYAFVAADGSVDVVRSGLSEADLGARVAALARS